MAVSESVPGQVDKKSGVPQERGVSRRRKGQAGFFFLLHSLVLVT